MKELTKLIAISITVLFAACGGGDEGTTPAPTGDEGGDEASTKVASLEAAVPANGDIVSGDFLLGAIVDSDAVEVRFMLDGREVGIVNEAPYQLKMNACDLSVGNHAYIVTVEDSEGNSDYVDQFFETKCD